MCPVDGYLTMQLSTWILGKTVFLTYCLVRRLAKGLPTVFATTPRDRYVFLESGVFWAPDQAFDDWENEEVDNACLEFARPGLDGLVLFDINVDQSFKCIPRDWRTLVASSPNPKEVHRWKKENDAIKFYMKTWGLEEVYLCR